MTKVYTDEWNDFQFRAPLYLDGHFEPYKFDLVKWNDCDPYEVVDSVTGKKKTITRYCFSVGTRRNKMKHYHGYKCEICTSKTLTEFLNYISRNGYKLISVTETSSSYYTLFYDIRQEEN